VEIKDKGLTNESWLGQTQTALVGSPSMRRCGQYLAATSCGVTRERCCAAMHMNVYAHNATYTVVSVCIHPGLALTPHVTDMGNGSGKTWQDLEGFKGFDILSQPGVWVDVVPLDVCPSSHLKRGPNLHLTIQRR